MKKRHTQKTGHRERQRWNCEGDTHHKLNVVEAVRQQVVFVLHETDVVQPLSHGLDGAAGAYQGVQREAFEKWVTIHPVAATVRLRELALPHHVPCNVTVKRTRHAQQATESASGNGRDRKSKKIEVGKWFQGTEETNVQKTVEKGRERESNLEEEGPLRRVSVRVRAGGEVRWLWR